ncbi:hypothetical protein ACIPSJ_50690 [Streptomyces sp. NPDC090088]|uniref:hypothetical protein n=1 Tax=Streptomyces sp. NPDC090088 TaxID=3365944 RepID=UPI00380CC3BA
MGPIRAVLTRAGPIRAAPTRAALRLTTVVLSSLRIRVVLSSLRIRVVLLPVTRVLMSVLVRMRLVLVWPAEVWG